MNIQLLIDSKYINYSIRLIMGLVFIYASYSKILDPVSFSNSIHNYGVTPLYLENIIALVLPLVEFIVGFSLITGIKYEASLDISIYMMALFILLISQAYFRGKSIDCGCFMSDVSPEDAAIKRFEMLKRIAEDIIFLGLLYKLKYDVNNKKSN